MSPTKSTKTPSTLLSSHSPIHMPIPSLIPQLFDQLLFLSHNNITAMNQRATHFNLGNNSQNYGSVYHKDYNPKQADPNQIKGPNPFRSNSVNIGEKGSFTTTNKMLYKAWDNVEKAKLDDQKLHELRTHHFKLGSYQPNDILTTNKIYHDKKQITGEASKNQEESKNKMRAHYHDFKEQNFTNYNSTYSNQYTPKEGNYGGKVGATHTENSICFGNNQLPLVTTSNASFTPKRVEVEIKKSNEATLGIMLGDKSQPMETINQQYFNRKEISKNSLPQSTMKELRSTHFNLGLMPQQYQTENDHYKKMHAAKQNQAKLTFEIPVYESGTWTDKDAQFNSSTTNKRELPNREVKPFERVAPNPRSGIQLGGHTSNYTSEFKNNFVSPSNPGRIELQINKKSNVVIGNDVGYYQTQHKSSYKANDLGNTRVNVDIKKLSKEDHFHIGGSTIQPKLTVYQDEHRRDVENRNKIFHKQNK